jgi:hypothetical protein
VAWTRGHRSVEVELSRVQAWIEQVDPILFGPNGDAGVIREHHDKVAVAAALVKEADDKNKNTLRLCAIFAAIPAVITIAKELHWLK